MFPNLRLSFLRVFLVAQEINYPSCCSVYHKIKQRKKASNLVIPLIIKRKPSPSRTNSTSLRSRAFENNTKKFVDTTGQNLYAAGGTGWFMDFTNHSKPSSIGQKHSHCLANYSNSVVIGYPGEKLPWKLLTITYKGEPLLQSPFICCCFD